MIADMRTADFDWLRYDYDGASSEEMTIFRFGPVLPEASGRPRSPRRPPEGCDGRVRGEARRCL